MQQFDSRPDLLNMFRKYLDGNATPEEIKFIETYYHFFDKEPDVLNSYSEDQKQLIGAEMENAIMEHTGAGKGTVVPLFPRWRKLAAAASILILLAAGAWFYLKDHTKPISAENGPLPKNDIAPGTDKAVLTLADGSQIVLDQAGTGLLARQGNVKINKTREGQLIYDAGAKEEAIRYNTVSTPAGGQFRITLPDGSKVWLNAMSSIQFPTVFTEKERQVKVAGEVYFEVSENPHQPFVVNVNDKQRITVLGTHFNVNAYQDEHVLKTTLMEGHVTVTGNYPKTEVLHLKPGQQSAMTAAGRLMVQDGVDTEEVLAWKNGLFRFDRTDMEAVMRQLSRWYDVKVEYEGKIPDRQFSGKIHRNVNASEALDILSFTGVHFRIEASPVAGGKKKIIVMP